MELRDFTRDRLEDIKGLDAARFCRAVVLADGGSPADVFEQKWANSPHVNLVRAASLRFMKGAVDGHDATTTGVLLPLTLSQAIVARAAPYAILPRLGAVMVPFSQKVPTSAANTIAGGWSIPGAKQKPLSAQDFAGTTLDPRTAATLLVLSADLVRFGGATADALIRDRLAVGIAAYVDRELLDPTAAFAITAGSGLPTISTTGNPAQDLALLLQAYAAAGGSLEAVVVVMSSANAIGARLSGHEAFRDLTRQGGVAAGVPVVASDSAAGVLAAIDSSMLLVADDGQIAISTSRQSSLKMVSDPNNESAAPVSMFQTNQIAMRAERVVTWQIAPGGAVAYATGVDYLGSAGSPV